MPHQQRHNSLLLCRLHDCGTNLFAAMNLSRFSAKGASTSSRFRIGFTTLLMMVVLISVSACGSSKISADASPTVQNTQTAVPMITIVTPTPGNPNGSGSGPVSTETTPLTPTPDQATNGQNGSYTVQQGDTLYGIAVRFNVSVQALMKANSITDATSLQAGQIIIIP